MIYEFIRPLTCNFNEIEKYIPKKGKILDVGCGHAILAKLAAEGSNKRNVLAIDSSSEKIQAAKKGSIPKNLLLKSIKLENVKGKFDCIIIVDVLYLLPFFAKKKMIMLVKRLLKPKGIFILVENGEGRGIIFKILRIQETLMTRFIKYTHTDYKGIYFLSVDKYRKIVEKLGLKIEKTINLKSIIPYPHFMIIAKNY